MSSVDNGMPDSDAARVSSAEPSPRRAQLASPEESVPVVATDWAMLRRLVPYGKPHARLFFVSVALMPLAALAAVAQPLLIKGAIDAVLVDESRALLLNAVWFFLLVICLEFAARFSRFYAMQLAGQRALAALRRDTFRKIQGLHISYFDRTPVGKVVTRVTNDIDSLGELVASGAIMAVADLFLLLCIVVFMLWLDWRLALVAFCAFPPLALIVRFFRGYARAAFRGIRAKIAVLNAYLAEQVQGISLVQAFGRQAECLEEYKGINASYRDANHAAIRYDALLYSVVEAVSAVTVALVLLFASTRAGLLGPEQSVAWVGTVVAFYEYIQRFFVPIRDLSQKYTIVQSSLAAAERIFSILDMDEDDAPEVKLPVSAQTKVAAGESSGVALSFEGVSFGYRPDRPVLKNVSFEIRHGETVAIVGATGAGKTTVTALATRLYDVNSGKVYVGGKDVRAQGRQELRGRFATVAQDVFLFAGTIAQNVALGESAPELSRVKEALVQVGAWPMIEARPLGIDAPVDERGGNFSAGERQLLAFARALYLRRDILILDEATANIDSETESLLQQGIGRMLEQTTAIVIAHRLSTIRHADRILVFHHGQIVEEGPHEVLLRTGGVYARLHRLQFDAPEDEAA